MRSTPDTIKTEVYIKYLEGYSIPQISEECRIAVGTVHAIVKEESRKDKSISYIREIAKMFKKNNLEISDVIAGVRLQNKIKKVGLSCLFFEDFLESTNTESFRMEEEHEQFLENIMRILQFEEQYQKKIEEIPAFINEKMDEYENLKREHEDLEEQINKLFLKYNITKSEIEEYKKEEIIFFQYKREYPKYSSWIVDEKLFDEAYIRVGKRFKPEILYEKLKAIYTKPNEHPDIIKKILKMD